MEGMNMSGKEYRHGCVDAGTEQCPCHLALTGDCLICGRLQGEDDCNCGWEGVCPYTVLMQNGGRVSDFRSETTAELIQWKEYTDGVTVLVLGVGRGFAQKASRPGSFVFLRRAEEGEKEPAARRSPRGNSRYYDTPISVLKAEESRGTIHLAVRREGPKSKALLEGLKTWEEGSGGWLWIRGVYSGGIQGVEFLKPSYIKGKRVLFITKGVGAAPALLAMTHLSGSMDGDSEGRITWLADDDKVGRELLEEYGVALGSSAEGGFPEYVKLSEPRQLARLPEKLKSGQYDVVAVMASDYYVKVIRDMVTALLPRAKYVWNNNAKMCCGEGICGACTEADAQGNVIRLCKCQRGDRGAAI